MNAMDFKTRYLAALPDDIPPDLIDYVTRFVRFSSTDVSSLTISDADKALLVEVGLPRSAAPMLEFRADNLLRSVDGVESTAVIGFDGAGDPIAIDLSSGAVVKYNHDNNMSPIHLAPSVVSLADCLCAFAECRGSRDGETLRAAVARLESVAGGPASWWMAQI